MGPYVISHYFHLYQFLLVKSPFWLFKSRKWHSMGVSQANSCPQAALHNDQSSGSETQIWKTHGKGSPMQWFLGCWIWRCFFQCLFLVSCPTFAGFIRLVLLGHTWTFQLLGINEVVFVAYRDGTRFSYHETYGSLQIAYWVQLYVSCCMFGHVCCLHPHSCT